MGFAAASGSPGSPHAAMAADSDDLASAVAIPDGAASNDAAGMLPMLPMAIFDDALSVLPDAPHQVQP